MAAGRETGQIAAAVEDAPAVAGKGRAIVLLWAALNAAALLPLALTPVPPLAQQYYNLARMKVLVDPTAPFIRQFFEVHWGPIPDLAMDLTVPWLARLTSVEAAANIFLGLALLLISSGTLALHVAIHRRWTVLPLAAALFLYNWLLLRGYANNLFALGLMLWGLAGWVATRRRGLLPNLVFGTASGVAIYLAHLFPLGVFGLVILSLEAASCWRGGRRGAEIACGAARIAAPFLLPAALLLASSTAEHVRDLGFWWSRKPQVLASLLMIAEPRSDALLIAASIALAVLALWRRWLVLAPGWPTVLAVLAASFLLLPWHVLGSSELDTRLGVAALFVALAAIRLRPIEPRMQHLALAGLGLVFAVRLAAVTISWSQDEAVLRDYRAAFAALKPGAALFLFEQDRRYFYPYQSSLYWNPPREKAVALALLDSPVLVPSTYLVRGHQPVIYASAYEPLHRFQTERPGPLLADRGDFEAWLRELREVCRGVARLFPAIYVGVLDPGRRLLPPPPGTRLVATAEDLYILEIAAWREAGDR